MRKLSAAVLAAPLLFSCVPSTPCSAQIAFDSAIGLALHNSPRIKLASNDVEKAQDALGIAKDIFIPSVVTTGGVGDTYGITLSVPTVFTINAQSLVFSFQQRSCIRAAHSDLKAAELALIEARQAVEEDATITYLSMNETQQALAALEEQYEYATGLVSIVQDRVNAGIDTELELKKAQRGALEIKLAQMGAEDSMDSLRAHLAELTGLSEDRMIAVPESMPPLPPLAATGSAFESTLPDSPGILAAQASADARLEHAKGDARYTWRPLITFGAQYGRVSPINNVSQFYNLHNNYNTANAGIQIELPLIDRVRKRAADESLADATRASLDLENMRREQAQGRLKLQRSMLELSTKAEIAELDLGIAQQQLNETTIRLHDKSGKSPVTPKEEASAHIDERQKYLDLLDAKLQSVKARVFFLRQSGQLDTWLITALKSSPAAGIGSDAVHP